MPKTNDVKIARDDLDLCEHGWSRLYPQPCPECDEAKPKTTVERLSQSMDLGLPTVAQREVGGAWLRKYGHRVHDDPDFCAAAIYRLMMLAKLEPSSPELACLLPGWRQE